MNGKDEFIAHICGLIVAFISFVFLVSIIILLSLFVNWLGGILGLWMMK